MGVSGICPQRRNVTGNESDSPGESTIFFQKKVLKDCASTRYTDADTKRLLLQDADFRHSWFVSSLNFARLLLLFAAVAFLLSSAFIYGSGVLLLRANDLGRQCVAASSSSMIPPSSRTYRFAMVTCSDGSSSVPHRSFEGLMELVTPNKRAYVDLHGYDFIDASDCLDRSRPPSWSKILAVRKHLASYEWVFWNDADSLVTNPTISLEDIVNSVVGDVEFQDMPDFIVTEDVTGVNAGMFFFRNSEWSQQFLELWWNQTSFIKPFGHSKSGDNDALKHLIRSMDAAEKRTHVRVAPMQCLFNSNLWRPSWKNGHRLISWTKSVWHGVYAKGDFMVHLAGLSDKKTWMKKILKELDEERIWSTGNRRAGPP
ncbi:hypothetical protein SELMODRAFT_443878 [Selaginella moellendorffii]|uniref:Glycosyltransferase CAZy family GT34-like protein n=1 Tax=Selaginella moellendorffii TaxID=88036 RepID=D8S569_SELML|nr:uncharacterized alpha-1,2-galactosyltransferase C1289.13c [Selaginella moellendorffii]EFJ20553.1 hypothetical protein SELMODRAFT_443878 [Selaginella moellendorffii]|eukprot:XP_002978567.1 uncharacterized alpha-1,2-galactosyltransferase C1289.13c [Selaginella moellendorffii]